MMNSDWIAIIGLIVTVLVAFLPFLFKMTSSLSAIEANFHMMKDEGDRREHRIDEHEDRLDDIDRTLENHSTRIRSIEENHTRIHQFDGVGERK